MTDLSVAVLQRREQIADWINLNRRVAITDLCRYFSISLATARRDLQALSEQGRIKRVHGGAVSVQSAIEQPQIVNRMFESLEQAEGNGQNSARRSILVFAPHFDDEAISCGGAIARHTAKGDRVVVVFMSRGDSGSTVPGHEMDPKTSERTLKAEAEKAGQVLGIVRQVYLDLDDGFMGWTPDLLREFVRLINRYRPSIVYAPHADESHSDHRVAHQLVSDAVPRAGWGAFPTLAERAWAVEEVRYYEMWTPIQRPNLYLDITAHVETKLEAIRQYASQLVMVPYDDGILGLNRFRGATTARYQYAEAFVQWKVTTR